MFGITGQNIGGAMQLGPDWARRRALICVDVCGGEGVQGRHEARARQGLGGDNRSRMGRSKHASGRRGEEA